MSAINYVSKQLDRLKRVAPKGKRVEYWMARDIQEPLGYDRWEDFVDVMKKAQKACESSGVDPVTQFHLGVKMVSIGSDAVRKIDDYFLTRYAAYLVAMNGNPRLEQIAKAQTYFAIQTRRAELFDKFGPDIPKRIELRQRVRDANRHLVGAAKVSGVQNYALFQDAGYRGLYDMGLVDIKQRKGVGGKEELLDHAGRQELAANEFRLTQTEEALKKREVKGDLEARRTHQDVGREVRDTIRRVGGTMPEDLPAEPSLGVIERERKKRELGDKNDEKAP